MKKFFRKTLYLGVIVCIALAGCQNPLEPPREAPVPRDTGRVVVTIGDAATGGARTIAPPQTEFTQKKQGTTP